MDLSALTPGAENEAESPNGTPSPPLGNDALHDQSGNVLSSTNEANETPTTATVGTVSGDVVATTQKNSCPGMRFAQYKGLGHTYTKVPADPFEFFRLPAIVRLIILETYLESVEDMHSRARTGCDCYRLEHGGWRYRELERHDLCYNLHKEFGCHAKFLPLLLTNRQMHDEFRPLRYRFGTFHIIPVNQLREGSLRDREPPSFNRDNWPWWTKLDADPMLTHITPYPENVAIRSKQLVKAPLIEFQRLPIEIWNEIRTVQLQISLSYPRHSDLVRKELKALADMLSERRRPLKMLTVELCWGRPWASELDAADEATWRKMVAPLKHVEAGQLLFQGRDLWDGDADVDAGEEENGEQRTFQCDNFEDFETGLEGADRDGRLEVEYWHCGC